IMRADGRAETGINAFDQRLAVDGMGQRLTHLHIVERSPGIVERQQNLARRISHFHLQLVVALEAADQFRRLKHRKRINVTSKHRSRRSRRVAYKTESDSGKL